MKTTSSLTQNSSPRANGATASGAGVSQHIRSAEKHMSMGKYGLALEELSQAQQIEPNNLYITAIIERVRDLQLKDSQSKPGPAPVPPSPLEGQRYLSVTVGSEFKGGIKDAEDESLMSPQELQRAVRQLTASADGFLKVGQHEKAFETLMKAYLLDPLAPEVLSCEQRVLPAWETARRGKVAEMASVQVPSPAAPEEQPAGNGAAELSRIEQLKRQKEAERRDRERALWREASNVPKMFREQPEKPPSQRPRPAGPDQQAEGFLQNLKKRKLF